MFCEPLTVGNWPPSVVVSGSIKCFNINLGFFCSSVDNAFGIRRGPVVLILDKVGPAGNQFVYFEKIRKGERVVKVHKISYVVTLRIPYMD